MIDAWYKKNGLKYENEQREQLIKNNSAVNTDDKDTNYKILKKMNENIFIYFNKFYKSNSTDQDDSIKEHSSFNANKEDNALYNHIDIQVNTT